MESPKIPSIAWRFDVSVWDTTEVLQKEPLDLNSEDLGRIPALPHLNSVNLVKLT